MKNKYWISKHRYYELKHFCRQYNDWKRELAETNILASTDISKAKDPNAQSRPTESLAMRKSKLKNYISMIDDSAKNADWVIGPYIVKGVTEGLSYEHLIANYDIPCSKDTYYSLYRKFFWLLSEARQ